MLQALNLSTFILNEKIFPLCFSWKIKRFMRLQSNFSKGKAFTMFACYFQDWNSTKRDFKAFLSYSRQYKRGSHFRHHLCSLRTFFCATFIKITLVEADYKLFFKICQIFLMTGHFNIIFLHICLQIFTNCDIYPTNWQNELQRNISYEIKVINCRISNAYSILFLLQSGQHGLAPKQTNLWQKLH